MFHTFTQAQNTQIGDAIFVWTVRGVASRVFYSRAPAASLYARVVFVFVWLRACVCECVTSAACVCDESIFAYYSRGVRLSHKYVQYDVFISFSFLNPPSACEAAAALEAEAAVGSVWTRIDNRVALCLCGNACVSVFVCVRVLYRRERVRQSSRPNMEAVAKHDFTATADDELSFKKNQVLKVC